MKTHSKLRKQPLRRGLGRLCAVLLAAAQIAAPVALPLLPRAVQAQGLPGMGDGGEMTVTAERRLGDQIARELYRDTDYIDDPVLVEYVDDIWQRLLAAARTRGELTPEIDERFALTVLLGRDRNINAFALPGGYLGLHLGLVAVVGSRDELATVLGHELSHVTQRHIARIMDRQSRHMPLMLAGMVLGMIAASKSSSPDAGQAVLMGSQAAFMQSQLSFSRDMEREADRVGFGVMTQAGFAPQGAAAMFERLQYASRLNDNGSYPYLRSHPLHSERLSDMRARFQFQSGTRAATLPLAMDHAMIAGRARVLTRPGTDVLHQWIAAASGGEFERSAPAQQAGTLYAAALAAGELRNFQAARALAQRLADRTADDAAAARLARLLAAEIELAARVPAKAAELLDAAAKTRPEMLLAAQAAAANGAPAPMVAPLRDWVAVHPRDATAWRTLAALYGAQNDTLRAIRADAEAHVATLDYPAARDRLRAAQELIRQGNRPGAAPIDYYEASIVDTRARAVEALAKEQAKEK